MSAVAFRARLFESAQPGARLCDLSMAIGIAADFEEYQDLAASDRDLCLAERLEGVSWFVEELPVATGVRMSRQEAQRLNFNRGRFHAR